MPRRFQFSLRAVFAVVTAAAVACAIWMKLPVSVRLAIVAVPATVLAWLFDADAILWLLLPPYGDPPKQCGPRYVIKWRRRGEKTSRE